jgi:hypothetical protein
MAHRQRVSTSYLGCVQRNVQRGMVAAAQGRRRQGQRREGGEGWCGTAPAARVAERERPASRGRPGSKEGNRTIHYKHEAARSCSQSHRTAPTRSVQPALRLPRARRS